jgi:hypothetical protein
VNCLFRWDSIKLTLWCLQSTIVDAHCDAGKTKVVSQEHANNGQPFKSWVFCRVHWALRALNSGSKVLIHHDY